MQRSPLQSLLVGLRARATRDLRDADRRLEPNRFRAVEAISDGHRRMIFELRHHIYVDLLGVLGRDDPLATGGVLSDAFDAYSTLIALFYDETLVGTVRLTISSEGPLELESYRHLSAYRRPGQLACELQRLMILPAYRCVAATGELLVSALRVAMRRGATQLFGAARTGNLGRLFQNVGARVLDPSPFRFSFLPHAEYQLIGLDLGQPRTFRRFTLVAGLDAWRYVARRSPGIALRVSRRDFSDRSPR